ncbi:MAG: hypothetical protein OEQ12_01500 [Nitrosopumilus sp.]|nr:hypothetical protein [Nitrosopumilus sp.]
MVTKKTTSNSESQKRSEASRKGWISRRKNAEQSSKKQTTTTKTSRKLTAEKLKKLQRQEKVRNTSRRKAQKQGRSLVTDKPKLKSQKPIRLARKASKKRASVR